MNQLASSDEVMSSFSVASSAVAIASASAILILLVVLHARRKERNLRARVDRLLERKASFTVIERNEHIHTRNFIIRGYRKCMSNCLRPSHTFLISPDFFNARSCNIQRDRQPARPYIRLIVWRGVRRNVSKSVLRRWEGIQCVCWSRKRPCSRYGEPSRDDLAS